MRRVVLFIGVSLDGYLADRKGRVGWMEGQGDGEGVVDSYSAFIQGVDTVILGWNTYHQVVTELSPEKWVYQGLASYVITHRKKAEENGIFFTGESPCELVKRLKETPGKDIWICGGGDVAGQLIAADLVDRYDISIIPTLLGGGIPLFPPLSGERKLKLIQVQHSDGITELIYERR